MAFRVGPLVLASLIAAATLSSVAGCDDDEDDCIQCCKCANDNSPIVYRPDAPGDCSSCAEQCQALADREFMGVEFDIVERIECPE